MKTAPVELLVVVVQVVDAVDCKIFVRSFSSWWWLINCVLGQSNPFVSRVVVVVPTDVELNSPWMEPNVSPQEQEEHFSSKGIARLDPNHPFEIPC